MRHVRTGDQVEVVAGKEKGKRGKVLRIDTEKGRAIVEKVNLIKRHTKPTQRAPHGGILEKEAAMHLSNIRVVCPKCDEPRRVGAKSIDERKVRACRKCGTAIEAA
ncbi:MAG: 50S ribosomal protein L24 [Myxococcota bacterium]